MFEKYSKNSPSRLKPMSPSFVLSSGWHLLATFFGSGLLRPASGTFGTLAGWLVYYFFLHGLNSSAILTIMVISFLAGIRACDLTGRHIGVHDHSSIVIDEVVAIWIVQYFVPFTFTWQALAFISFRFFDIVKIQPVRYFDSHPFWQNGAGVMLDDLAAAGQSVLLLWLLGRIF